MTGIPSALDRAGYRPVYHPHEVNHCPGCGQSQWILGRITAECAFCATAIPLCATGLTGAGLMRPRIDAVETTLAA